MRQIPTLILAIAVSALAGCAEDHDRSADGNACKPLAPPDRQAQWNLVTPGVASLGIDMPGKKRLQPNAISTAACVHNDNKGNEQKSHDLQKIG